MMYNHREWRGRGNRTGSFRETVAVCHMPTVADYYFFIFPKNNNLILGISLSFCAGL